MPCNTMQYNTIQCIAMQCYTMRCNAMQCNAIQHGNAMQCDNTMEQWNNTMEHNGT